MIKLKEGLEKDDLARLVHDEVHVDEYRSKMGDDKDVVVVSFKVAYKDPAEDLNEFLEKTYDFVLDADVSSGEMEDGEYIVFVELDREPEVINEIITILSDLENLTAIKLDQWRIRYHKSTEEHPADYDELKSLIPTTPEQYQMKFKKDQVDLDSLRAAAGVKVNTKAPKNDYTDELKSAAGIQ